MFQFTTTNVINSLTDLTTGKNLFGYETELFKVLRVGNFTKDGVKEAYKKVANIPEMAKVNLDLSTLKGITPGDQLRLHIYIGLAQGSQDSRYSNDLIYKAKPFTVDFIWEKGTADPDDDSSTDMKVQAANTAAKLVNIINKYEVLVYGDKLLDVSATGSMITLTAKTEYQRFKIVNIDKFDGNANYFMGAYNTIKSIDELPAIASTATTEGVFAGKEGFGTYSWILHNLRIPTNERTSAFAPNQDENPIPGALYNQYTIHYVKDRGTLGTNAVGDQVTSHTTHVFYVRQGEVTTAFEAAANGAAITFENA